MQHARQVPREGAQAPAADDGDDLSCVVTPAVVVERFPHVFASVDSLRWFERNHRTELVECGALLHVNGRKMYHLRRFGAAALAIGQRLASAASRKG